jgi:hypothetical protein
MNAVDIPSRSPDTKSGKTYGITSFANQRANPIKKKNTHIILSDFFILSFLSNSK